MRPNRDDPAIIEAAVKNIMPEVMEWININEQEPPFDGTAFDQVLDVVKRIPRQDGYAIAKILDSDYYWNCDANLVTTLDNIQIHVYQVYQDAVSEWIKRENIQPTFKVGDRIKYTRIDEKKFGEITQIRRHTAEYVILEEGVDYPKTFGRTGLIKNFEDVQLAEKVYE